MDYDKKRTWAEISLSALENNVREVRGALPEGCRFLGVVKANAYGHGVLPVARRLAELGAEYLAVACLDEALELRRAGIALPILILGATDAAYASLLAQNDITQAVECAEKGRALSASLASGERLKVHLKLDTGMGRLGFATEEASLREAAEVMGLPGLIPEGCFTHLAVSEDSSPEQADYTKGQFERFCAACDFLEAASGKRFTLRHCANSGCVVEHPEYALDMARPGLLTYGLYPGAGKGGLHLQPVMSLKSRVAAVTHHKKGDSISYGRTWRAERDCTLAVIPIGYADGLHRVLSNRLEVLLRGQRVRQVGRICMDMCMLDVTDLPGVAVGDVATLFGRDGEAVLPVEEMAEGAGTISYEITCAVAPRVPRIYLD